MTQKDQEQLKLEINHIFESGANEIRIFNMVVDFINSIHSRAFEDAIKKELIFRKPKETWFEEQEKIVDEKQKKYSWVDIESGQRYTCSKEYYEQNLKNWEAAYPKKIDLANINISIITGTDGEQNNNAISYKHIFDFSEQMKDFKPAVYTIGVDSFGGAHAYCLSQKVGEEVTVLLSNTLADKNDFDKQVAVLSKTFNAKIINEFEKPITKKSNRCCGRCDGSHDICVADRVCEKHKELGCEICYGSRTV